MRSGLIFDIRRFTIQDGPGIRTTVFLKGCALDCPWCHNPEGKNFRIDLWYFEKKCIHCGACLAKCPEGALAFSDGEERHVLIDRTKCTLCGNCVSECPTEALVFDGQSIGVNAVMREVSKDLDFYRLSGGGVTISGGDPLYQHEFALEILRRCKRKRLHTAIETCLYAEKAIVQRFFPVVDLFIVDLKIYDPVKHREVTGVNNTVILENLKTLATSRRTAVVRIPLIPGYSGSVRNVEDICAFLGATAKAFPVEFINYNSLGCSKYKLMGKESFMDETVRPYTKEQMKAFEAVAERRGLLVLRNGM
ncbi:MAG: glycyl-radical enzyme activating protein [Spirochaetia bacterium]|jgi:pyruvate formate lyase activating enzyme